MTSGGGSSGFGAGLWVLDSEKMLQGEYWTNRYIVAAADLAAAVAIGVSITNIERAVHYSTVLFTKFRVSDGQPLTDVYQVVNLNSYGAAAIGTLQLMPLFNVVRVDFNTAGGGRPSRKYLRGCLSESSVNFTQLDGGYITFMDANYTGPMIDLAGFVDVDGQQITSGSAYPFVAMRQLRRGSKRKTAAPNTGTTV